MATKADSKVKKETLTDPPPDRPREIMQKAVEFIDSATGHAQDGLTDLTDEFFQRALGGRAPLGSGWRRKATTDLADRLEWLLEVVERQSVGWAKFGRKYVRQLVRLWTGDTAAKT